MTAPSIRDVATQFRTVSAEARATQIDAPGFPAQVIMDADLTDLAAKYLQEYDWLLREIDRMKLVIPGKEAA